MRVTVSWKCSKNCAPRRFPKVRGNESSPVHRSPKSRLLYPLFETDLCLYLSYHSTAGTLSASLYVCLLIGAAEWRRAHFIMLRRVIHVWQATAALS